MNWAGKRNREEQSTTACSWRRDKTILPTWIVSTEKKNVGQREEKKADRRMDSELDSKNYTINTGKIGEEWEKKWQIWMLRKKLVKSSKFCS